MERQRAIENLVIMQYLMNYMGIRCIQVVFLPKKTTYSWELSTAGKAACIDCKANRYDCTGMGFA